jgi:hypothetical protein
MQINYKQARIKLILRLKNLLILLTVLVFFFVSSSVCFAPTKLMSDDELSDTTGQALFAITQMNSLNGSANIIHIDLGLTLTMNALFNSMKMGYYNNSGGNTGWDLDLTSLYLGSTNLSTSPMVMNGVFLEFGFDNISSNARTLNYIEVGSMSNSGTLSGAINTINGLIASGGTGQNGGVMLRQTAAGSKTLTFNNQILGYLFAAKYVYNSSTVNGIFQHIPTYSP